MLETTATFVRHISIGEKFEYIPTSQLFFDYQEQLLYWLNQDALYLIVLFHIE